MTPTDTGTLAVTNVSASADAVGGPLVVTGTIAVGDSTTLTIAHRDPAAAYLAAAAQALEERGIVLDRGVGILAVNPLTAPLPGGARLDPLFTLLSPPLRDVLPALEKPSQNQIAEALLKTLGAERTGVGRADSGRRVIESQLVAWGADPEGFAVRDGSGLSRHNYVSPETIVRVLDAMRRDPAFAVFYDALPVAGVDGTIAGRMRGTPAQGNVRAKTGFVDKARSLSGYVTSADGELLIFSLLCNNWTTPVRAVERVQDEIAVRLAGLALKAR
jgi:D-alanyl-D-alanine carboxypeptidase/D-alanyl-D-alanine-endopeptidase (penicillin-binding protein 4)